MPKIDIKKLPTSRVELAIALSGGEFKPYWEGAYKTAQEAVELKGFRKGAAPERLAKGAIDREKVFERAASAAVRETFADVVEEKKWTVIEESRIELIPAKEGISFKVQITLFPEINLPEYRKIGKEIVRTQSEKEKTIAVAPEEIQKAIEWLKNSRGAAVADLSAGALAEANDAFARSLGPQFVSMSDVEKSVAEGLREEKIVREREKKRVELVKRIATAATIDVPAILIDRTYDGLLANIRALQKKGAEPNEEMKKSLYARAEANVRGNLVIHEIAKREHLEPTKEEVRATAREQNLDLEKSYDYTYGVALQQKFFAFFEQL